MSDPNTHTDGDDFLADALRRQEEAYRDMLAHSQREDQEFWERHREREAQAAKFLGAAFERVFGRPLYEDVADNAQPESGPSDTNESSHNSAYDGFQYGSYYDEYSNTDTNCEGEPNTAGAQAGDTVTEADPTPEPEPEEIPFANQEPGRLAMIAEAPSHVAKTLGAIDPIEVRRFMDAVQKAKARAVDEGVKLTDRQVYLNLRSKLESGVADAPEDTKEFYKLMVQIADLCLDGKGRNARLRF